NCKKTRQNKEGASCNCKINISLSYKPAIQKLYVTSTNPKHNHPIPVKNPKDSVIQEPHKSPSPLDDHHSEIEGNSNPNYYFLLISKKKIQIIPPFVP
ncbi:unnamed protein product, partial [Gordionus sp. m RMFG-2023]